MLFCACWLRTAGPPCCAGLTPQPADNGCLLPTMEDARLAALVQDLAAEGAGVVGVERQTKNLEEIFLSLTNTQTGKEVG